MKLKLLITAALLGLALPAAADFKLVQDAYEVALSDLRLPRANGGTIAFKECDTCEYRRLRVGSDMRYRLNGKDVTLKQFREAMATVEDRKGEAVTVLHHLERNQVTAVSVNL
jgi:hypothetical protein